MLSPLGLGNLQQLVTCIQIPANPTLVGQSCTQFVEKSTSLHTGICYWYCCRPMLLGTGWHAWHQSNPKYHLKTTRHVTATYNTQKSGDITPIIHNNWQSFSNNYNGMARSQSKRLSNKFPRNLVKSVIIYRQHDCCLCNWFSMTTIH